MAPTALIRDPAAAPAFAPGWCTSVMGTGIVANAAVQLPAVGAALRPVAVVVWLLAAALLAGLAGRACRARRFAWRDPLWGAPPMAAMTVGAGALLVGRDVLGLSLAVDVAAVLWALGTLAGLTSALSAPWRLRGEAIRPVWLVAVVPPVVSAATGAALVPHAAALRAACIALLVVGVAAAAPLLALVVRRLARHGAGPAEGVPTFWIVLGPLGQSVTAAGLLAPRDVGLAYGLAVLGAAMGWLALVAALTARTARREGLPFTPAWWSFVFPVGTCTTGAAVLAAHTGAAPLQAAALLLFALLVVAWLVTGARTAHGLLRAPAPLPAPAPAQ